MSSIQSPIPVENDSSLCLAESATTHTILQERKYFLHLKECEGKITTISGDSNLVVGSGRACIILPMGNEFVINDALFSPHSKRNLLSFKDICSNGFHVETGTEGGREYLYLTQMVGCRKQIFEKLPSFSSGLYYTYIRKIDKHVAMNLKFTDPISFQLWHD